MPEILTYSARSSEDLAEYVRISGIAASIACERAGCEPPTLEEVETVQAL
jgi:hypothetical protein